jgi:hypothetical protein
MAEPAPATPGHVLSADEFEGALGLLEAAERQGRQHSAGQFVFSLAFTLTGLVGVFACPLGALIQFVDPRIGQPMLVVGLAATALFTLLNTLRRDGQPFSLDALLGAGHADEALEARAGGQRGRKLALGLLLVVGVGSLVAGVVRLVYSVAALRVVSVPALALIAWPLLAVFVLTAVRRYREYVYFARVARLRRSFSARYVEARRTEATEVVLQAEEARLLSRVQGRGLAASVRQAVEQFETAGGNLYAIVLQPEARAALRSLAPEAQAALHDRLTQLQQAPRPAEARPTADGTGLVIFDGAHTVAYQVDETHRRVTVHSLAAATESAHGG